MGKKGVSLETTLPLGQAVDYLEDLVRSLRQGRVVVQKGKEFIQLTPAALVEIELEAVRKKDKEKFVLELSWRVDADARHDEHQVRIGSQPAAPVMAEQTIEMVCASEVCEPEEVAPGITPPPETEPPAESLVWPDEPQAEPNTIPIQPASPEELAAQATSEQIAQATMEEPPAPASQKKPAAKSRPRGSAGRG
ncbi:MAG: amphi-Trp domain-containing protein [Desulfarculus sp.]|nr:amphi-Trp domain-containing protein [Desulfarculus sp.]